VESAVYAEFRDLVYDRSGINLGEGKQVLVSARIGKRMRALGLDDHAEYLEYVRAHEDEGELTHLLDAISTNFTSFFREAEHFDLMSKVLSRWIAQGQRRFRLWSCASSTGEEPYSMAIVLAEAGRRTELDARILATDISTRVLARAAEGRYDAERVEPVSEELRRRYLVQRRNGTEDTYQVSPHLRRLVSYHRLNLSKPPFPMRGPMDIVFCRNVMIYFDNAVRQRMLAEIHRLLRPGGYLMVGHAESLAGLGTEFRTVEPSVYVKPDEGQAS